MTKYTITEDRLLELLRAEIRDQIVNQHKCVNHYYDNKEYWENILSSDDKVLSYKSHDDRIIRIPTRSELLDHVEPSFYKEVNCWTDTYSLNEFLVYMLNMKQQDVHEIFGHCTDNIEGASIIGSNLINGLYDDSYLGVVYDDDGFPRISVVGDDYADTNGGTYIYKDDLWKLIRTKELASKYYESNKDFIEGRIGKAKDLSGCKDSPSWKSKMEYFRLGQDYYDLLETYMDDEGKAICQSKRDAHERSMTEMHARIQKRREEDNQ